MATFEVTPEDLHSLAGQLSGLFGELGQATDGIRMAAAGAAQNGRLEGAIAGFLGDWSRGVHELQTKLSELAQRLEAGGSAYEGADGHIAADFGSG